VEEVKKCGPEGEEGIKGGEGEGGREGGKDGG